MKQIYININYTFKYLKSGIMRFVYEKFNSILNEKSALTWDDKPIFPANIFSFPPQKQRLLSYPKNGCSFRVYVLPGDKIGTYVHMTHFILNKSNDF